MGERLPGRRGALATPAAFSVRITLDECSPDESIALVTDDG